MDLYQPQALVCKILWAGGHINLGVGRENFIRFLGVSITSAPHQVSKQKQSFGTTRELGDFHLPLFLCIREVVFKPPGGLCNTVVYNATGMIRPQAGRRKKRERMMLAMSASWGKKKGKVVENHSAGMV